LPTYDYECNNCNHKFELFQNIKDKKKRKCSNCGKNVLIRLIGTGSAIIFKGEGFYVNDYK